MTPVLHQPSFDAKAVAKRVGSQHATSVPTETLDAALAEKIKAITAQRSEAVE